MDIDTKHGGQFRLFLLGGFGVAVLDAPVPVESDARAPSGFPLRQPLHGT